MEYYTTVRDGMVKQLGSSAAQKLLSKSLFAVVIGSNDVFGYSGSSNLRKASTPQQYVDSMASSLKDYLKVTTIQHGFSCLKLLRNFSFSNVMSL